MDGHWLWVWVGRDGTMFVSYCSVTIVLSGFLYICYIIILDMFRAVLCSSSGGQIVLLQPLVSSLSVNSRTVWRLRADCFWAGPGPARKAVYKPVWHIPLLSVQWINSCWWTEELSEACRVSCQNKFVKIVHLVGFVIKNANICSAPP